MKAFPLLLHLGIVIDIAGTVHRIKDPSHLPRYHRHPYHSDNFDESYFITDFGNDTIH